MNDNYQVWDSRNSNVMGPFEKGEANSLAHELNHFVARNEFPMFYSESMKVTGPFYVRKIR